MEETIDTKIQALKKSNLDPIDQLDQAYDQIYAASIGRNDPDRKLLVNTALQWLLCAFRDLNVHELLVAAATKPDGTRYRSLKIRKLRNILSNFMVEGPSGIVRLAHLTIRPYLEKRMDENTNGEPVFELSVANSTAALACLHILRSAQHQDSSAAQSVTGESDCDSSKVMSLNDYASFYWSLHCRAASRSGSIPKELKDLLQSIYGDFGAAPTTGVSRLTPFHNAIRQNQDGVVDYLIASNMSLEQKNKTGNTPLHEAVRFQARGVVKALLRGGAMINSQNNAGNTALHLAAFVGDVGITQELLREEAPVNVLNFAGQLPIHLAVLHSCTDVVRTFISSGVDLDLSDSKGNTALHYAVLTNQEAMISMLSQGGCAMNPQNQAGNTPLHLATSSTSEVIFSSLLPNGARSDIKNHDGRLPYSINSLENPTRSPRLSSKLDNPQDRSLDISLSSKSEGDASTLCYKCANFAYWVNTSARSMYHDHHSSYRALQQSSNVGCKLCKAILELISTSDSVPDTSRNQILTNIVVKVDLCRNSKGRTFQDLLIVKMGNEVVATLELFIDRGA